MANHPVAVNAHPKRRAIQGDPELLSLAQAPKGRNTRGLPVLADELLLEILSYFPPTPLYSEVAGTMFLDPESCGLSVERRTTLHALTRTCSGLWRFFRPYIWERIEAFESIATGQVPDRPLDAEGKRAFATELVRQLEVVTIRDPVLARYVRVVNVEITDFSLRNVSAELGRCLEQFPNLSAVKICTDIMTDPLSKRIAFQDGFKSRTYNQVKEVVITGLAFPLLDACPNVKTIRIVGTPPMESILPFLQRSQNVERLLRSVPPTNLPDIAQIFPRLKELSVFVVPANDFESIVVQTRGFTNIKVLLVYLELYQHTATKHAQALLNRLATALRAANGRRIEKIMVCYVRPSVASVIEEHTQISEAV